MATATRLAHGTSINTSEAVHNNSKFSQLCEVLENYRYLAVSGILFFQGCILVPVLLLMTQFYSIGISDITALVASLSTMAVLVTNISGLGMKTNMIVFGLNLVAMLSLILIHLVNI
ncbi:hypothetical protein RCC89_11575 [Cytophagaceae bacterium ABcell3]|nr:hypothetical protein RCC89_11575 [Cytophagaceae bacterium ABcell3]